MSYIYLLYNKSTKMYYVGVRYAKNCHPSDFWRSYFTSSKSVHKLIDLYGKEDFKFKIVKKYKNAKDAILQEHKYTLKVIKKKNYINAGAGIAVRNDICSLAGKIGGNIQKIKKLGFHKLSKEEHLKNCSLGGKINSLKHNWGDSNKQSERGKRGGPKNIGFKWYNNSKKDFKYTKKQQILLSFDKFIEHNPQFKQGRIKNAQN